MNCRISFEFLFIKTHPTDKLHSGCGFVIQLGVGIRYKICQGGSFDKKEFKRNLKFHRLVPRVLHTVHLTSTGNPVPGNQEYCLAPSETMVEQVEKIRSLTQSIV